MVEQGFLRLIRKEDGDIIVVVGEGNDRGDITSVSTVQFYTPMSGGGGSSRTWFALVQLMAAMAEDNLDPYQDGRKPDYINVTDQQELVKWGKQCSQAREEYHEDKDSN